MRIDCNREREILAKTIANLASLIADRAGVMAEKYSGTGRENDWNGIGDLSSLAADMAVAYATISGKPDSANEYLEAARQESK